MIERFGIVLLVLALEVRRLLVGVLEVLVALVLLFEEWGWRPLARALERLGKFPFWQRFEAWVGRLPPYGALMLFGAPAILLFPLKLFGLWLIANGHYASALALIIGAKLVGTAFVARVFLLTRPKLMTIPWFARLYNSVVPWQEAIVARIKSSAAWQAAHRIGTSVRSFGRQVWARVAPEIRRRTAAARAAVESLIATLFARR